jgi:replicative DNA helicase
MNIAEAVAISHKKSVSYFSMAFTSSQLTQKIVASIARLDSRDFLKGYIEDSDWPRITAAISIISEAPIYIDSGENNSIEKIENELRNFKGKEGLGLVIIDSVQHISFLDYDGAARKLRSLARNFNVPLIITSRIKDPSMRFNKRPIVQDLAEWQCLEEEADAIIFLYRDELYDEGTPDKGMAELIISKNNYGPTGIIRLVYLDKYNKFENYVPEIYKDQSLNSG